MSETIIIICDYLFDSTKFSLKKELIFMKWMRTTIWSAMGSMLQTLS